MLKTTTNTTKKKKKPSSERESSGPQTKSISGPKAVLSMGCPRGIGPEICLRTVFHRGAPPSVIVGSRAVLSAAGRALGYPSGRVDALPAFEPTHAQRGPSLLEVGPALSGARRSWGHPEQLDGVAQLTYIEEGYRLAARHGLPLVTAPVSKEVIARSGLARARKFLGHTEWLEKLDGAPHSVMCFSSPRLTCSLATTHVPVRNLPRVLSPTLVTRAICELADLLLRRGASRPILAVCSLNPHGGEGKLLGKEEGTAIVPGIEAAARVLGRRARVMGPVGAETAFRKAVSGGFDGVVAMYHDQATIPMKLIDFGGAVNVTQGLSIVRTSVDHGTAYDIAGRGVADAKAMSAALTLAVQLGGTRRRVPHGAF